jgi:hypothetical protein
MFDTLYFWWINRKRKRMNAKSRFDYKVPADLQPKDKDRFGKVDPDMPAAGKVTPEEKEDREDKVVEIPVGGIDPVTGTVYEKIVRPDGVDPIYKEVNIDNTLPTTEKETETTESTEIDTDHE